MNFNTPNTIISKLQEPDAEYEWHKAWQSFFDIYHIVIKVMVENEFRRNNWYNITHQMTEDIIVSVLMSLNKYFVEKKYIKEKGKFRYLLKKIVFRRTVDYMRKNYKYMQQESIEDEENSNNERYIDKEDFLKKLDDNEIQAFKYSIILDVYNVIRKDFSPTTCLAFEMIKLENKNTKEVALELGISPKQATDGIYRLMQRLKENIENDKGLRELYE